MGRRVIEIDAISRDIIAVYDDVEAAGAAVGMPPSRVDNSCKKKRFQRGGRSFYRFEDQYVRDEEWSQSYNCPVYCTDGTRLRIFHDRLEAARVCIVSDNTIQSYLAKGYGKGLRWGRCRRGRDHLVEQLRKEAANG